MASHLLTFQPRFADLVASGDKRQTIRKPRPCVVGDILHLWEGDRTHKTRKLGVGRVVEIFYIRIAEPAIIALRQAGDPWHPVSAERLRPFAKLDGFNTAMEFFMFFGDHYGLPFEGILIRWEAL